MARPRRGPRGRSDRRRILEEVDEARGDAPVENTMEAGEALVMRHMKKLAAVSMRLDKELAAKKPDADLITTLNERMICLVKESKGLAALQGGLARAAKVRSEIRVDTSPDMIRLEGVEALDAQMNPLPEPSGPRPVH